jgi:beta-galactosidase
MKATAIISLFGACGLLTSVLHADDVAGLASGVIRAPEPKGESPREHLSLDTNWKFHLGDDWPGAPRLDKAGDSTGPASVRFDDTVWRSINLPHDWAIELPFDQTADANHGFKALGPGFPTNSIGWYRRTFDLPAADSGKRIWLTFDGVFRDTTVWVNGWLVKRHEGGYYPFREDITAVVRLGGKNTIAVRVDASKFEGWFYEGAGLTVRDWFKCQRCTSQPSRGSTGFKAGGWSGEKFSGRRCSAALRMNRARNFTRSSE